MLNSHPPPHHHHDIINLWRHAYGQPQRDMMGASGDACALSEPESESESAAESETNEVTSSADASQERVDVQQLNQSNELEETMSSCSSQPKPAPFSLLTSASDDINIRPLHIHRGVQFDEDGTRLSSGWFEEEDGQSVYDTDRCNIDIRTTDMSVDEFNRDYYLKRPVLIVPTTASSIQSIRRLRKKWSCHHLIKHGHVTVQLGTAHQLTAYGEGRRRMTLEQYIRQMEIERETPADEHGNCTNSSSSSSSSPPCTSSPSVPNFSRTYYLFDRGNFFRSAPKLRRDYDPPEYFRQDVYNPSLTFALGVSGTGISHHYHKDAWNQVIHGRKRWFIYSPSAGVPPGGYNQFDPAHVWYESTYHRLSEDELPMECVQYPGETLYIPEDWLHATINIGETLAVAGQSLTPAQGSIVWHVNQALDDEQYLGVALDHLHHVVARYPSFAQVYNLIGNLHMDRGRADEAIDAYTKAVQLNPLYAMAWTSLGQAELESGDASAAVMSYERAHSLAPSLDEAVIGLSRAYIANNQSAKAIPILRQAIDASRKEAAEQGEETEAAGRSRSFHAKLVAMLRQLERDAPGSAYASTSTTTHPSPSNSPAASSISTSASASAFTIQQS